MRFVTQCHVRFVTHVTCGLWHMSHAVCDTCVHKSLFLESSKNLYLLGWHVTMSQSSRIMSQTACIMSHVIDLILQVKNSWDVLHTSHAVCDTLVTRSLWHTRHAQFVTHISCKFCDTHVMCGFWHMSGAVCDTSFAVCNTCHMQFVTQVMRGLWHMTCAVCDTLHARFVTCQVYVCAISCYILLYLGIFISAWKYLLWYTVFGPASLQFMDYPSLAQVYRKSELSVHGVLSQYWERLHHGMSQVWFNSLRNK